MEKKLPQLYSIKMKISYDLGFIAYKKRGELLWAIASKENVINLHSAAFETVFGRNLVHA